MIVDACAVLKGWWREMGLHVVHCGTLQVDSASQSGKEPTCPAAPVELQVSSFVLLLCSSRSMCQEGPDPLPPPPKALMHHALLLRVSNCCRTYPHGSAKH